MFRRLPKSFGKYMKQPPPAFGGYPSMGMNNGMDPNYQGYNYSGTSGSDPLSSPKLLMPRPSRHFVDPESFVDRPPVNYVVNIVPQGRQYVVERLGRYYKTLDPGIWFLIPWVDKIRYSYSVKEQGIEIPDQSAITDDNVMVEIDGVLFLRIVDAEKASYNVENPIYNIINLAQTTMRSEIGRMTLDNLFRERASLNKDIVETLRREASDWGIECKRYEIRDIIVSELVRRSMDLQADAERRKRKLILESEGESVAEVNKASGLKTAQEYAADAQKYSILRQAEAEAESIRIRSKAVASNLEIVSESIDKSKKGNEALSLRVAEKYIEAFGELAQKGNTVVLSQPISDPAAFSSQALSVFNAIQNRGSSS